MAFNQTQANWVKTALRLPRDLHIDVHAEAKRQDRTFNSQIVSTLRQSTPQAQRHQEVKQ